MVANQVDSNLSNLVSNIDPELNVRYTINVSKDYRFDGDILDGVNTSLSFTFEANTTDIPSLQLPWGLPNIPWLSASNPVFVFQSYDIEVNRGEQLATSTQWTEQYTRSTDLDPTSTRKYFDILETLTMPVWKTDLTYYNNKNLGAPFAIDLATNKRLRRIFGLSIAQGTLRLRSFEPFPLDPYALLNVDFETFEGRIDRAVISKEIVNDITVYELNISWTGGKVDAPSIPTYLLNG